mmetsp:Transcript_56180/g.154922  ORF Transcript_56180/g.154922 Transcript_56180/m.154922 type:complete len:262 (-) Transcript_56180:219-1004(-)
MLPYTRNFELNSAATGSRSRGMGAEDQKVFESVRAGKVRTAEQRRAAAFKLVNYPWVRIIKTQALLWDHDITFGATPTNNDIQYHWLTIACAKSVSFMPIDSPVVHHNYYKSRAQITSSRTPQRIQVIDAVLQTHRRLAAIGFYQGPDSGSGVGVGVGLGLGPDSAVGAAATAGNRSSSDIGSDLGTGSDSGSAPHQPHDPTHVQIWCSFASHIFEWAETRVPHMLVHDYKRLVGRAMAIIEAEARAGENDQSNIPRQPRR